MLYADRMENTYGASTVAGGVVSNPPSRPSRGEGPKVPESLDELQETVDALRQAVEELTTRLDPVLKPQGMKMEMVTTDAPLRINTRIDVGASPGRSQVAERVANLRGSVDEALSKLRTLTGRLDV